MIGAILGFWSGIPGPVKKIAMYAGIAVGALYLMRLYSNKQYDKGVQSGKIVAIKQMEKENMAAWEAERQKIEDARKGVYAEALKVDADRKALAAQKEELDRVRIVTTANLKAALATIAEKRKGQDVDIQKIPADALDDALRQWSRDLSNSPNP